MYPCAAVFLVCLVCLVGVHCGCLGVVFAGGDVNAKDDSGYTPMHCAAIYGRLEVLQALHRAGAHRCHAFDCFSPVSAPVIGVSAVLSAAVCVWYGAVVWCRVHIIVVCVYVCMWCGVDRREPHSNHQGRENCS